MPKPAKKTKKTKLKKISSEELRNKLKVHQLKTKQAFDKKYPHVEKYLKKKGLEIEKLRGHSAKIIGAGALTGTLLLAPPATEKVVKNTKAGIKSITKTAIETQITAQQKLLDAMSSILPKGVRPLTRSEEKTLEQIFEEALGVKTKATLEGEHLNTTYGYIGAEQHLKRYPGDTVDQHGEGIILKEGIAPGLGAWGYFATNKNALTNDLEETEKWYAVVQTLYLPDWNTRQPYLRNWYKYRKVLIVNTDNGNAVVASIADSGPAAWTGKHFGGSPEVMYYLGGSRYKKGAVILFFVDDPENKVPLGPVEYNKLELADANLYQI